MSRRLPDGSIMNNAEWASVRKRAINAYDHRCNICGTELDAKAKPYTRTSIEIDHIIPISRGGSPYDLNNLQVLCMVCNRRKSNNLEHDLEALKPENQLPVSGAW